MKQGMKMLIMALIVLYVLSPLDLAPGPVDDMLLVLLSALTNNLLKENNDAE